MCGGGERGGVTARKRKYKRTVCKKVQVRFISQEEVLSVETEKKNKER